MFIRILWFLALAIFCIDSAHGQISVNGDSLMLEVDININNEVIYIHDLRKGETIFSLAQLFHIPYNDLLRINQLENARDIHTGSQIRIPLDIKYMDTGVTPPEDHIPVYYKVKTKETLFKISHSYFRQAIQDLINRNDIKTFSLREGQKLIIGWWPGKGIEKWQQPIITHAPETISMPDIHSHIENADSIISIPEIVNIETTTAPDTIISINTKGVAYWDKAGNDFENLFVMHNSARPNSFIILKNPITGKKVTARVIMEIPSSIYTSDIDIVITPAVAKQLGALDSRFRIEMDYYE